MNITELSVIALAQHIRDKKVSAREVVTSYLDRIAQVNPKINAVVVLRAEQALQRADELDQSLARGEVTGPLHGVPFTLKDIFNTKGDIVTAGTLGLKDHVADSDAIVAQRLYQSGGILLGKTNTPEFENGLDTDNLVYGKTLNPYNTEYSAGGSSGGSAAIVAACGSAFDVGSDTGGSLRVPASYCGITTIRPTVGRVPSTGLMSGLRQGFMGLVSSEGPLTRNVMDLELILNLISGVDGIDPRAIAMPFNSLLTQEVKKFKVAYFTDNTVVNVIPAVANAVLNAVQALTDSGVKVTENRPAVIASGFEIFHELVGSNIEKILAAIIESLNVKKVSPMLDQFIARTKSKACDLNTFLERWIRLDQYRSDMLQFMQQYDVLICPVTPWAPLPCEQYMWDEKNFLGASYCWAISMANLPTVVVRTGTSDEGLPLGVQIIAKPWREDMALAAAKQIEKMLGGWQAPLV